MTGIDVITWHPSDHQISKAVDGRFIRSRHNWLLALVTSRNKWLITAVANRYNLLAEAIGYVMILSPVQ
jgi:hypothetical protein